MQKALFCSIIDWETRGVYMRTRKVVKNLRQKHDQLTMTIRWFIAAVWTFCCAVAVNTTAQTKSHVASEPVGWIATCARMQQIMLICYMHSLPNIVFQLLKYSAQI